MGFFLTELLFIALNLIGQNWAFFFPQKGFAFASASSQVILTFYLWLCSWEFRDGDLHMRSLSWSALGVKTCKGEGEEWLGRGISWTVTWFQHISQLIPVECWDWDTFIVACQIKTWELSMCISAWISHYLWCQPGWNYKIGWHDPHCSRGVKGQGKYSSISSLHYKCLVPRSNLGHHSIYGEPILLLFRTNYFFLMSPNMRITLLWFLLPPYPEET